MQNDSLKIGYCLTNGLTVVRHSPLQMILGAAVVYLLNMVRWIFFYLPHGRYFAPIYQLFVISVLIAGWWFFCLDAVRGHLVKLAVIFCGFRFYFKVLTTWITLSLMGFVGLILLVIPGIVVMLMFNMSILIILDSDLSPLAALKMSAKITKGSLMKLLGLFCIWFMVGFLFWICTVEFPKMVIAIESTRVVVSTILGIIGFVLISPWTTASLATAYDVLYKKYQSAQTMA